MSQTTEKAFESYVEEILLSQSGWYPVDVSGWDKEQALFPSQIVAFLQDSQPKLWKEMEALHGAGWSRCCWRH